MATRILYENYLIEDNITSFTSSTEAVGFDKENIFTDRRRSKVWRSTTVASTQWLRFDLGITSRPNAFVMIGKRNEPVQISPSATITLQGNETDVWTSPSFSVVVPVTDRAILAFSPTKDGFHTEALRYWRVTISDPTNVKGYVEVSSIFLGRYFEPVRGRVQIPWSSQYIDLTQTTYSESGNSFSNIKAKSDSFSMQWFGLTVSEKEEIDYIFDVYGIGVPFFVALDPMEAMSSDQTYYLRYIKLIDPPTVSLESPGVFAIDMSCREEI